MSFADQRQNPSTRFRNMIGGVRHILPLLGSARGKIYALLVFEDWPVTTSDILRSISRFSAICAWHRWSVANPPSLDFERRSTGEEVRIGSHPLLNGFLLHSLNAIWRAKAIEPIIFASCCCALNKFLFPFKIVQNRTRYFSNNLLTIFLSAIGFCDGYLYENNRFLWKFL